MGVRPFGWQVMAPTWLPWFGWHVMVPTWLPWLLPTLLLSMHGSSDYSLMQQLLSTPQRLVQSCTLHLWVPGLCTAFFSLDERVDLKCPGWKFLSSLVPSLWERLLFLVLQHQSWLDYICAEPKFCPPWWHCINDEYSIPCVGSRMQLSSAGLEHSWCRLLFLTHHLKPFACLLGLAVATANTHVL